MILDKPIVFLDYDGVVNTFIWREYPRSNKFKVDIAHSEDGFVNDFQAICWLNELYNKIPFDIIVTSTWRLFPNYKEVLYNGGLNSKIKVLGKTPQIINGSRGDEIQSWIKLNHFTNNFVILDDDTDMGDLIDHLVLCNPYYGFKVPEFHKAIEILKNK